MRGPDSQFKGVNTIVETPDSLNTVHRQIEVAPAGKSMLNTVMNGLEEATSFLHKYQNLNRQRARESRQDLSKLDIRKLSKSAFNVQQVKKVEDLVDTIASRKFDIEELIDHINQFRNAFSNDSAQQYMGLLALKEQLKENLPQGKNSHSALAHIDTLLQPAQTSQALKAHSLGYALVEWSAENHLSDRDSLRHVLQQTYPISFDNMHKALSDLRQKFGDQKIQFGTTEIFKQLSARYHKAGRNINKGELFELMKNMSQLKTLMALFDECQSLAQLLVPPDQSKRSAISLTARFLVGVTSVQNKTWLEKSDMSQLLKNLGITNIREKNTFAVQFKRILGLVPQDLYREEEQKQQALDVVFQFMDTMARQEGRHA